MTVRDVAAIFTIWLEVVARFCQPSIYSIASMVGAFFFYSFAVWVDFIWFRNKLICCTPFNYSAVSLRVKERGKSIAVANKTNKKEKNARSFQKQKERLFRVLLPTRKLAWRKHTWLNMQSNIPTSDIYIVGQLRILRHFNWTRLFFGLIKLASSIIAFHSNLQCWIRID